VLCKRVEDEQLPVSEPRIQTSPGIVKESETYRIYRRIVPAGIEDYRRVGGILGGNYAVALANANVEICYQPTFSVTLKVPSNRSHHTSSIAILGVRP
jgi:hypothetical protein